MLKRGIVVLFTVMCLFCLPVVVVLAQSYESFISLLIDLPGWTAGDPTGMDMSSGGMKGINASREYTKGDQMIHAGILIGMNMMGVWQSSYHEGLKMETPDGLMEVKRVKGFLVFHSFNKKEKVGIIAVLLEEATNEGDIGAVFVFNYQGLDDNEGLSLAQKFDWNKMKEKVKTI